MGSRVHGVCDFQREVSGCFVKESSQGLFDVLKVFALSNLGISTDARK
jgi:hypothetical protein